PPRPPPACAASSRRWALWNTAPRAPAPPLVIVRGGAPGPAGGPDDRQGSISEGVELTQPAGLEARRHHEEICTGLDPVGAGIVERKPSTEAIAVGAGLLGEVTLGLGIPRAQHHELHVPREHPVQRPP